MPTVPVYGDLRVRETPAPQVRATPETFGAAQGRQLQQLGQGVGNLVDDLSGIQLKLQDRKNTTAVLNAEVTLRDAETEYHASVRERKGVNADGATADTEKWWADQQQEVAKGLENDAQRRAFEKIYQSRRGPSMDFASRHEAQQGLIANNEATEASVAATQQNGIENPGAFKENSDAIRRAYRADGVINGHSKEVVDAKILKAITEMHAGAIGLMVDDAPGAARTYYNAHKKEIAPSARDKIEDALRAGELTGFAQRKATEVMAAESDPAEQLRIVRETVAAGPRQAAAIAEIKSRQAEQKSFTTQEQNEARDAALREAMAPGSTTDTYEKLPVELRMTMSGAQQAEMAAWFAAATEKKTSGRKVDDPDARIAAHNSFANGQLRTVEDLKPFRPLLTDSTLETYENRIVKNQQVPYAVLLREFEQRQDEEYKDFGKSDFETWNAFQNFVDATTKDGAYTANEVRDLADDFFMQGGKTPFFGFDDDTFDEVLQENPQFMAEVQTVIDGAGVDADLRGTAGAIRMLSTFEMPFTRHNMAAFLILQANRKVLNPANITSLATQLEGRDAK